MADPEVSVESVQVKIGGTVQTLTLAQARKLKEALEGLFGKDPSFCGRQHVGDWNFYAKPWWHQPWITYSTTGHSSGITLSTATNNLVIDLDDGSAGSFSSIGS